MTEEKSAWQWAGQFLSANSAYFFNDLLLPPAFFAETMSHSHLCTFYLAFPVLEPPVFTARLCSSQASLLPASCRSQFNPEDFHLGLPLALTRNLPSSTFLVCLIRPRHPPEWLCSEFLWFGHSSDLPALPVSSLALSVCSTFPSCSSWAPLTQKPWRLTFPTTGMFRALSPSLYSLGPVLFQKLRDQSFFLTPPLIIPTNCLIVSVCKLSSCPD